MNIPEKTDSNTYMNNIQDTFDSLSEELVAGLFLYWQAASEILHDSGITLHEPGPETFSIENNFFSAVFLYSYFRAGISRSRRILYTAVNQCLRGMVTGCDNILDDEYKKTLDTSLPESSSKFRSVLDIMVSDRVLFSILYNGWKKNDLTSEQMISASTESLRALTKSGAQEASEEGGAGKRLPPDTILNTIHHYKTGLLFQSPWAVPFIIEKNMTGDISALKDALYNIGMGCQILDDMVDFGMDIIMNRHNYVASLILFGSNRKERSRLELKPVDFFNQSNKDALFDFPDAMKAASIKALGYLEKGTSALFCNEHSFMVQTTIDFIARRIGADVFLGKI
jgi:hypothetical protein